MVIDNMSITRALARVVRSMKTRAEKVGDIEGT